MADPQTPNPERKPDGKPVIHHVPAILTGTAALIAALSTIYVNVRGDRHDDAHPAPAVASAPVATAAPPKESPGAPARVRLAVERIAVEHDGSPGTTDWRFTVEADGEPLFAFQQDGLDDVGGRNVAVPADAAGVLQRSSRPVHVMVKGWRGRWFRLGSTADAEGEAMLMPSGAIAPLRVQASAADAGAFVFYFSAEPEVAQ